MKHGRTKVNSRDYNGRNKFKRVSVYKQSIWVVCKLNSRDCEISLKMCMYIPSKLCQGIEKY